MRLRRSRTLAALGHLMLDDPERAREALTGARQGRLTGALALHAGLPPDPDQVRNRARWAWLTGDLEAAAAALTQHDGSRQLRGVKGDLEALAPGGRPVPRAERTWQADGPPRVLHVLTNSLPHTRSGYTLRTHDILQAQQRAGIAATALTRPGYPATIGKVQSGPVDSLDGIDYRRSMPWPLAAGEAERVDQWARDLIAVAAAHRATHLHSTTHYPNALAAQAAAAALSLPWVHEVRGQLERTWASTRRHAGDPDPYGSSRFLQWRAKEAEVAAAADHVITISSPMLEDLVERGVSRDRISLVPNGIDESVLDLPSDAAAQRRLAGLPTEGMWVGYVGAVVHYEGLSTLVSAVAEARASGSDVRLAIVGDGLAWPALAAQAQRLGLEGAVEMPGRVSRDGARQWLSRFDAVALPRMDHDVTRLVPPLKLVEAMGAGKPVVVTDLPALTELVRDGQNGLVMRPDSSTDLAAALVRLADQPALRDTLGGAARHTATSRTWPRLVETYRHAYREVARP